MTKIINLNRFRKRKLERDRERQAEINRRLHGRTKAERAHEALQQQKLASAVDKARLEHGSTPAPGIAEQAEGGRAGTQITDGETEEPPE